MSGQGRACRAACLSPFGGGTDSLGPDTNRVRCPLRAAVLGIAWQGEVVAMNRTRAIRSRLSGVMVSADRHGAGINRIPSIEPTPATARGEHRSAMDAQPIRALPRPCVAWLRRLAWCTVLSQPRGCLPHRCHVMGCTLGSVERYGASAGGPVRHEPVGSDDPAILTRAVYRPAGQQTPLPGDATLTEATA
jgi:hypothetical protein